MQNVNFAPLQFILEKKLVVDEKLMSICVHM